MNEYGDLCSFICNSFSSSFGLSERKVLGIGFIYIYYYSIKQQQSYAVYITTGYLTFYELSLL